MVYVFDCVVYGYVTIWKDVNPAHKNNRKTINYRESKEKYKKKINL